MDQPEMSQTKQTAQTDSVAAPVGRVGGQRPSTLSTGSDASSGAPETGPLGPGQRWSLARKRAVVLRLLRGEAPELVSRDIGVPVYKLERWLEKAEAALEDALKSQKLAILVSIPGIADVTAISMIVEMPELGTLDGKKAASLAGLAPVSRQSGKWRGK